MGWIEEKPQPHNDDECPYCRVLLEIVSVEIGLARVTMHSICPNCRMVPKNPDETVQNDVGRRRALFFLRRPR
jgi:hypothetical protein